MLIEVQARKREHAVADTVAKDAVRTLVQEAVARNPGLDELRGTALFNPERDAVIKLLNSFEAAKQARGITSQRGIAGALAARRRAGTARARPEGGSLSPAIRESEIQKPQPSRKPRRQHQNLPR
jgi:hypothetical protein